MKTRWVTLRKKQRGALSLSVILVFLAVVGITGFAVWQVMSYNKNKDADGNLQNATANNVNTATISEDCVAQTGDENICRLGAITDLSQFSSEVHVTMGDQTSVIEYDGKGNHRMSGLANAITVDGRDYIKFNDQWYDTSGDDTQAPTNPTSGFGIATTAGITYENLGKEPCGDDTCFRYRMSGGILGDGVIICLFGDEDYLPRYYEATGGMTGDIKMEITYKEVTIAAPEGARPITELYQ